MNNITLKQIENMKHCIGFRKDRIMRKKYVAFRNYYTTSDDNKSWDELAILGLAEKRSFPNGVGNNPQCYFVTKKGLELLERLLECKIVEEKS
jgi:hypothetical protein